MCTTVENAYAQAVLKYNPNPLKLDPTRSLTLRRKFGAEISKRFNRFKRALLKLLVEDNAFGAVENVFCPTGKGGGVDPTCGKGGGKGLTKATVTEKGVKFKTGKPVTFTYARNLEKAPGPGKDDQFQQKVEPAGRYMVHSTSSKPPSHLEIGEVTFKSPLVVPQNTGTDPNARLYDENSWKANLSRHYGGKTGKALSKALAEDGFDAVVTVSSYKGTTYTGEIVDLARFTVNLTENTRWQFHTTEKQLELFKAWLWAQLAADVIPWDMPTADEWWLEQYIKTAYEKGLGQAFDAVKYPHYLESEDFYEGTKGQFLEDSFRRPVSKERVKLLAARSYTDLSGITSQMSDTINRELVDGLIRGESPRRTGSKLNKIVDGYKNRGLAIARTETIRALNEGQLDAMEALGVEDAGVSVEWRVSGGTVKGGPTKSNLMYPSPCPMCAPLDKTVWKVKEAHGMLPRHPNCMCSWIPAGVGENYKKQKRTQGKLKAAIEKSLKAEHPKTKSKTAAKKKSRWSGADTKVAKKRPKPVV